MEPKKEGASEMSPDSGISDAQALADLRKEGDEAIKVLRKHEWDMLANRLNSAIIEIELRVAPLRSALEQIARIDMPHPTDIEEPTNGVGGTYYNTQVIALRGLGRLE